MTNEPEILQDTQIIEKDGLRIVIIRNKCISAGICTVYAENTFDLDDYGIAIIKEGDWDRFEKVIAAAQSCPVYAIEVYKDGKQIYPEV